MLAHKKNKAHKNHLLIFPVILSFAITIVIALFTHAFSSVTISGNSSDSVAAQTSVKAFPGAIGFAAQSSHGRGGRVIYVTNLNASGSGSLREALEATGPRIVLFKVGGTIRLGSSRLRITNPYLYIAGHTAPAPGITIADANFEVLTHNVLVRHLRFRAGDSPSGYTPSNRDSLVIRGNPSNYFDPNNISTYNVYVDNVSATWGIDGTIDIGSGIRDITIADSIIAEGLRNSLHEKGEHSTGLLIAENSHNITITNNLLAHNLSRNPYLKSGTSVEFINNYVYNWGKLTATFGDPEKFGNKIAANWIGNYYQKGPNTTGEEMYLVSSQVPTNANKWMIFLQDNLGPNRTSSTQPENYIMRAGDSRKFVVSSPVFTGSGVPAISSTQVLSRVLDRAGARLPIVDRIDTRILNETKNQTGSHKDSMAQAGGYLSDKSTSTITDTDSDGLPDTWERDRGLNPNNVNDSSADRNRDGYTNIEEYLSELAGDIPVSSLPTVSPSPSALSSVPVSPSPRSVTPSPTINVSPSPSITPLSSPSGISMIRAINFEGPTLTNEGITYQSEQQVADLTVRGNRFSNQSIPLNPSTTTTMSQILRSSVWGNSSNPLSISLANIPTGSYRIYLYSWEDNNSQTFSASADGQNIINNYQSGTAGSWKKHGPFDLVISDGVLDIRVSGGDANISALEIWKQSTQTPQVSSSPSPVATSLTTLRVRALGTPAFGQYPKLTIYAQDKSIYENYVTNNYDLYPSDGTLQLNQKYDLQDIKVGFTNDAAGENNGKYEDRNLRVDYLEFNGTKYESEGATVYTIGSWGDANGCNQGYKQSEWLHCSYVSPLGGFIQYRR